MLLEIDADARYLLYSAKLRLYSAAVIVRAYAQNIFRAEGEHMLRMAQELLSAAVSAEEAVIEIESYQSAAFNDNFICSSVSERTSL